MQRLEGLERQVLVLVLARLQLAAMLRVLRVLARVQLVLARVPVQM